jgi:hypothetical protein
MNHSDKQAVKILPGFKCLKIDYRVVPSERTLLKLVRPDIDPDTATIVFSLSLDSEEEIKSQAILREHNNFIVSFLHEEPWLDPDGMMLSIGKDLEAVSQEAYASGDIKVIFTWDDLLYHVANLNYLDYFFLPPENYDELTNLSKEAHKFYYQWTQTGKSESIILEKYVENLNQKKDKIRENFPEYKISEFYWDYFIHMAQKYYRDVLLELERRKSEDVSEIVDIAKKNYRQPHENRLVKRDRPWRCPYCQKWFEQGNKNGKWQTSCGQNKCNRERDRLRKTPPTDWIGSSPKQRRCKECRKPRLLNLDRICKKCFTQTDT